MERKMVPVESIVRVVGRLRNKNELRATWSMFQVAYMFFCVSRLLMQQRCPWTCSIERDCSIPKPIFGDKSVLTSEVILEKSIKSCEGLV